MRLKFAIPVIVLIVSFSACLTVYSEGEFAGGDGTLNNPYQIQTAEHLNSVRNYLDKHFIQTADINLGVAPYNADTGWVPIGDSISRFTGSYDGQNYTITGLTINRAMDISNSHVGLFGYTSNSAHLKNIKLLNANVQGGKFIGVLAGWSQNSTICNSSSAGGDVRGYSDAGGLVGVQYGGLITDSYTTGTVNGTDINVGGLVGFSDKSTDYSLIQRCYSTAEVSGGDDVGGLVGDNSGIVKDSYATGNVSGPNSGGLVGNNRSRNGYGGQILSSYSAGNGNCSLVGRTEAWNATVLAYTSNSFWDISTSGVNSNTTGGTGKTTADMQNLNTFTDTSTEGLDTSWNFTGTWNIDGGYPYLRKPLTISGTFTVDNKTFDGNTDAVISTNNLVLTGVQGGDDVFLNPVSAAFEDEDAAGGKGVNLINSSLGGTHADNYILINCAPTTTADILKKEITVTGSFVAYNKFYDGTTSAAIEGNNLVLSGVIEGDEVTLSPAAAFEDVNAGKDKTVTLSAGSTISGLDSNNYTLSLTGAPFTTADILGSVNGPSVGENLVAYWSYEEGLTADYGGSNFSLGGFGLDGSSPNAGQYKGRKAVKFEKMKQQYLKTDQYLLDAGTNFSYMAWYYLTQPISGSDRYFVLESTGDFHPASYGLRNDGVTSKGQVFTNGGISTFMDVEGQAHGASTGRWYNIIVTYDAPSNRHTAYINGNLAGTIDAAVVNDLTGLIIGSYRNLDDRFWEGYIDEVAVWNRVLTQEEINYLQTNQLSGEPTYTVSYDGNGNTGGTAPIDNSIFEEGALVTVLGNTEGLVKEGYTFTGWNTQADGNGTDYGEGATFVRGSDDITLYAKWTINEYTVTFDSQGGSTAGSMTANYDTTITAPQEPTKEGYIFGGWYKEPECTNVWGFNIDKVTANTTLYAKWTINEYTVTFDSQGGSAAGSMTANYDTAITAPQEPTKEGYIFGGWYKEPECTNVWDFNIDKVTSDVTLYAKWTQHSYTISTIGNQTMVPLNTGYEANTQEEKIITVTRTGTGILTNVTAALSGQHSDSFIITQFPAETLDGTTNSTVLGVKAKNGLTAGTYTVSVVITADNMVPVEFLITQVVNAPVVNIPDAPIAPTNISASGGDEKVSLTWSHSSGATGYKIYTSMAAGSYEEEPKTVSGSVYSCEITGLTNGNAYYFVIKAANSGGESQSSAEVSAVPMSVPGRATEVVAVAGNQQATVTFNEPVDDGGSDITGYIVTSNPGDITASGTGISITVTGLTNGITYTFTVKAVNEKGNSLDSIPSNEVTPAAPSDSNSSNNNSDTDNDQSSDQDNNQNNDESNDVSNNVSSDQSIAMDIIINGKKQSQGATATIAKEGDKTVATITVDQEKLNAKLNEEGENSKLVLSVTKNADKVTGEFNGQMVKNMETKNAVVEIRTENAAYTLPALQINIDDVSNKIGKQVELKDIKVNIEIAKPAAETVKVIESIAKQKEYTIVVPPIDFTITCSAKGKTVEVSKFNAYVERLVEVPEGIDPDKITTGVVLNNDGSVSHVPTVVAVIDGKYYAKINSLSNSTYSVINNIKKITDVENHWSKINVNDMVSRLILESSDGLNYEPDIHITRADFINIVARALGLKVAEGSVVFSDVKEYEWFYDFVSTTFEQGIIKGYDDGTFRPERNTSRQEAMVIIARAMQIAGLKIDMTQDEIVAELNKFVDGQEVDDWAKEFVAFCIKRGIISGYGNGKIDVKANITRAETATVIRRMLIEANLIDDVSTRD